MNKELEKKQIVQEVGRGLRKLALLHEDAALTPDQGMLIRHIKERLRYLLDHDFAHLLRLMYRLDIEEKAFAKALSMPEPADTLAQMVLQRELQKAKTRIAYQKQPTHGNDTMG